MSEAGAGMDDMVSLGPGDGGYGVDYEFDQSDKVVGSATTPRLESYKAYE